MTNYTAEMLRATLEKIAKSSTCEPTRAYSNGVLKMADDYEKQFAALVTQQQESEDDQ